MKYSPVTGPKFAFICFFCGKNDETGREPVVADLDRKPFARDSYAHVRCIIPSNAEIAASDPRREHS